MKSLKKELQSVSKEFDVLTAKSKALTAEFKKKAAEQLKKARAAVRPEIAARKTACALKSLTKTMEKITKAVEKFEKEQRAKNLTAKSSPHRNAGTKKKTVGRKTPVKKMPSTTKKPGKPTATDQVLKTIHGSKNGVDVPALKKKTGFDEKKIRNIVSRAFKQGKIKRVGRGIYIAA